ncbi:MAG: hypothetical protein K2Y35_04905 [Burkholderiales bacterium]|nr:hypothetical protein [Burkholderiales bacterium]
MEHLVSFRSGPRRLARNHPYRQEHALKPNTFSASPTASTIIRRCLAVLALACCAGPAAAAEAPGPVAVTIDWLATNGRCEFMLTKDDEGYGIVLKMDPIIPLAPGDVIVGKLSTINFTGRVVKEATGEATMMRAMMYGARRKDAVKQMVEWSRFCKPPAE